MYGITVAGTGWTEGQLTLGAAALLKSGAKVILHTDRCGCAGWLRAQGVPFESLDALYECCDDFDAHAEAAAQRVIEAAEADEVVYGVADVRDRSVAALAARCGGSLRVVAGPPVEGPLAALATGAVVCVEASDWESFRLCARDNCLVRELDSRELASEVKLKLMEVYPEACDVWLLQGDGAPVSLPLYRLDRAAAFDHRTCVLAPAQRDIMKLERYDFSHLMEIIGFLCSPTGCPWDRVQTHESLRPYIVEEAYEVIDAIDEDSPEHLYDELGDMLLQVALHAEIARRHGEFDISDVTTAICDKMIKRHTHVFGRDRADDAGEVLGLWSRNKMAERGQKTHAEALRGVTRALPATLRGVKVLKRAGDAGLCETDASAAYAHCMSALEALRGAEDPETATGDLLMALCDLSRLNGVDMEIALNRAADRFIARFERVEGEILRNGESFDNLKTERLRKYWELVKL